MEGNRFDDLTRLFSAGGSRRGVIRGLATGLIAGAAGLLRLDGADAAKCRGFGHICREGANCCDGGCAKDSRGRRRCCTKNGGVCTDSGRCCGQSRCGLIGQNQEQVLVCCVPVGAACDPNGDNVCCNSRDFQLACGGVGSKPICCIPDGQAVEGSGKTDEEAAAGCCSGLAAEGICTSTCEAPGAVCDRRQGLYCCTGLCSEGLCCLPSGAVCDAGSGPSCCFGATCTNGRCCAFPEEACDEVNGPDCCFGSCVNGACLAG